MKLSVELASWRRKVAGMAQLGPCQRTARREKCPDTRRLQSGHCGCSEDWQDRKGAVSSFERSSERDRVTRGGGVDKGTYWHPRERRLRSRQRKFQTMKGGCPGEVSGSLVWGYCSFLRQVRLGFRFLLPIFAFSLTEYIGGPTTSYSHFVYSVNSKIQTPYIFC